MVTYEICAEKLEKELLIIDPKRGVYPFPRGLGVGRFKSKEEADKFLDKKRAKLDKLIDKSGYQDYTLTVIRIDAPHILKA